jgi:hypothetical protein
MVTVEYLNDSLDVGGAASRSCFEIRWRERLLLVRQSYC